MEAGIEGLGVLRNTMVVERSRNDSDRVSPSSRSLRTVKRAVAVILLWSGMAVAQTPSNEPIKIGWIGHLTGILSAYGQDMLRAAEMAVSDINASGGVLGRKLQLVVRDDRGILRRLLRSYGS